MEEPKFNRDDVERLLMHEDDLLHTRFNFLLTTEAIMLAAVTQVWKELPALRFAIGWFGLAITLVLFLTTLNLSRKLGWLMKEYDKIDGEKGLTAQYASQRYYRWPSTLSLLTLVVPGIAALGWVLVLTRGWKP